MKRIGNEQRHVLVLGARNSGFIRALRKGLPTGARLCLGGGAAAKMQVGDSERLAHVAESPWDMEAWRAEAQEYGAFDLILVLDLPHWWDGRIDALAQLSDLLEPEDGRLWVQYFNALCLDMLRRRLGAGAQGGINLGMPLHRYSQMDLGSWLGFGRMTGLVQRSLWALADERVLPLFHGKKKSVRIPFAGKEINIREQTDAISLGAFVHGVEFSKSAGQGTRPDIHISQMSGHALQTFLYPDPGEFEGPVNRLVAKNEVRLWKAGQEPVMPSEWAYLLKLFEDAADVENVLLVGAQWGGALLTLRKNYPKWNWTAVESDADLVAIGHAAYPELKKDLFLWNPTEKMPFDDQSFDLVVSLGYCSRNQPQLSALLVPEIKRLSQRYAAHFEDATGAERSLLQKHVPLPEIYLKFGIMAKPQLWKDANDKPTGQYALAIDLRKETEANEQSGDAEQ